MFSLGMSDPKSGGVMFACSFISVSLLIIIKKSVKAGGGGG